jgi:hypothetical protein
MTLIDKGPITRRDALKAGMAAVAASGGLLGATGFAFADDTLAEIKKRGELVTATEMQFQPFDISDNGVYRGSTATSSTRWPRRWASKSPTSTCRGPACCLASTPRSSTSALRR